MKEQIARYRKRILHAAMSRLQRKTGGQLLIINLPNGEIETVEITENFMTQLLLRFEGMTRGEFGAEEGNTVIRTAYEQAVEINRDSEYLTETGKMIVEDLLNEVVEYVKENHASGVISNGN